MEKVAGVISRALKPGRKVVSAVKFSDGSIEEIRTATFEDEVAPKEEANGGPYREQPDKKPVQPDKIIVKKEQKKPAAATSVAAPRRGCPFPNFESAEIKARRVLMAFLDPDQIEDFKRYNRFISVGAMTGHRYLITSRHANDELALRRAVLFDVDDDRSICTHDWDVPAAEEMLTLHIYLRIDGGERFLRDFPGDILDEGIIYDPDGGAIQISTDSDDTVLRQTVIQVVDRILHESEDN